MLNMTATQAAAAPERPGLAADASLLGALLAHALDEVDFGILLVAEGGQVLHMNHRARHALGTRHGLQLQGQQLHVTDARSLARLHDALRDAARHGLRRLLTVGQGDDRQLAAMVPVQPGVAALLLGRTSLCEDLSMHCFARTHALTGAEARVLAALGRGVTPAEIAREQGVKISTVRTQITAIRQKTGASTTTALVRLVAGLPPMVSALRA